MFLWGDYLLHDRMKTSPQKFTKKLHMTRITVAI